jgi:hypothetical protein
MLIEYSTEVLQLSSIYSDHAQKTQIDATDVRLAIKSLSRKSQNPALEREVNEKLLILIHCISIQFILVSSRARIT